MHIQKTARAVLTLTLACPIVACSNRSCGFNMAGVPIISLAVFTRLWICDLALTALKYRFSGCPLETYHWHTKWKETANEHNSGGLLTDTMERTELNFTCCRSWSRDVSTSTVMWTSSLSAPSWHEEVWKGAHGTCVPFPVLARWLWWGTLKRKSNCLGKWWPRWEVLRACMSSRHQP